MVRRVAIAASFLACLTVGPTVPAFGSGLGCVPTITKLRYRPQITYQCTGSAALTTVVAQVTRTSDLAVAPSTVTFSATGVTVDLNTTLASGAGYTVALAANDGVDPEFDLSSPWTTLPPPAHPSLSVEYFTAMDPSAVRDMLHRIDAANLFAVPIDARVIDASTGSMTLSQVESALAGHQAALVVGGDASFAYPANLGGGLAWFASHGHGVVSAGQTHWAPATGVWAYQSAVGLNTSWDTTWDIFKDNVQLPAFEVSGGDLQTSTVRAHFLTKGLSAFHVYGFGSGEVAPHFGLGTNILAYLRPTAGFISGIYPQALLTERQVGASRLVDLGYRPWAYTVAAGGFDPAVSPGGAVLARALWWSMNRIPPYGTHFTAKPPNPSAWATVTFRFSATDPDLDHSGALHYHYRLDGGSWRLAVGNTAVFYNLAKGRRHTVSVYASDSGGNRDPKAASYTFLVSANARS
jgi:hypothetical protein